MREITNDHREHEIVIEAEQQQRKEIKLIGRQRKIPGLTMWEFNESTKELMPAKYKPAAVLISASLTESDTTRTYKCVVNENCIYFQSLNGKNARRKLQKAKLL